MCGGFVIVPVDRLSVFVRDAKMPHPARLDRVWSCARDDQAARAQLLSQYYPSQLHKYWLLNAIYHARTEAERSGKNTEAAKWSKAAAEKRIKTRKQRGRDSVSPIRGRDDELQTSCSRIRVPRRCS